MSGTDKKVYWGRSRDSSVTFFSDNCSDDSAESVYANVPFGSDDESDGEGSQDQSETYTNVIPDYYTDKLVYPKHSPYEYTDEEFRTMDHYEFLKTLGFKHPPTLPPYLNANLLNDSPKFDYKKHPYQYQRSNQVYINDQFKYEINQLGLMDNYGPSTPVGEPMKQLGYPGGSGHTGGAVSPPMSKTVKQLQRPPLYRASSSTRSIKEDLIRKRDTAQLAEPLKHQEYIDDVAKSKNMVPNHVMLNHLITCNLKIDEVLTCSCIHRFAGKYITQIVYFPIETVEVNPGANTNTNTDTNTNNTTTQPTDNQRNQR